MSAAEKEPYRMRARCGKCGCEYGTITETGAQDVVRCAECSAFQYNAPRTETGKAVRSIQTAHAAIKPALRAEILVRANLRCELCRREPKKPTDELHVGHLLSVADGHARGLSDAQINDPENLVAMCAECNLGLSRQTVPAWLLINVIVTRIERTEKMRRERDRE